MSVSGAHAKPYACAVPQCATGPSAPTTRFYEQASKRLLLVTSGTDSGAFMCCCGGKAVDNFTRENVALEADFGFKSEQAVEALSLVPKRGKATTHFCDNGPEFVSMRLDQWPYSNKVALEFSRPAKPTDNALSNPSTIAFVKNCSIPIGSNHSLMPGSPWLPKETITTGIIHTVRSGINYRWNSPERRRRKRHNTPDLLLILA